MSKALTLQPGQFYGAVDQRWRTGLVTLSLLNHAVVRQVPPHSHEHIFLSLLLQGGYREFVGEHCIDYGPLTLVFHPEHFDHRDEITVPGTLFFVAEAHPELLAKRERRHRALATIRDLSGGPAVWAMLRLVDAVLGHRQDAIECEEPITEVLGDLLGATPAPAARPRWLRLVEEYLHGCFREPVSLRALADIAGVHPMHVARVFRRHHGCTIRSFLQRRRVLHACERIARGREGLASVAVDSGFYDQSHMTHVFRHVTGLTPTAYRKLSVYGTGRG
jgi:AraC family transcriptional regulator